MAFNMFVRILSDLWSHLLLIAQNLLLLSASAYWTLGKANFGRFDSMGVLLLFVGATACLEDGYISVACYVATIAILHWLQVVRALRLCGLSTLSVRLRHVNASRMDAIDHEVVLCNFLLGLREVHVQVLVAAADATTTSIIGLLLDVIVPLLLLPRIGILRLQKVSSGRRHSDLEVVVPTSSVMARFALAEMARGIVATSGEVDVPVRLRTLHIVHGGERLGADVLRRLCDIERTRTRTATDGTIVAVFLLPRPAILADLHRLGHGEAPNNPFHFLPFSFFTLVEALIVQNFALLLPQLHPYIFDFVLYQQFFIILLLHLSLIMLRRVSPLLLR